MYNKEATSGWLLYLLYILSKLKIYLVECGEDKHSLGEFPQFS